LCALWEHYYFHVGASASNNHRESSDTTADGGPFPCSSLACARPDAVSVGSPLRVDTATIPTGGMLFLRVNEQQGEEGEVHLEGLLRTDGCSGAAQTLRAFSVCGTLVEPISGVPHLIRRDTDEAAAGGATWGKASESLERRERETPTTQELATTSLVYLPAVPSWLPLWSLLSPSDAISSSGGGECGSSSESSGIAHLSETRMTGADKTPPHEPASAFIGDEPNISALDPALNGQAAVGSGDNVGGGGGGGGGGGRGAVRLVQTVATSQAPYRYAVVLHFWDVADAASFVDRVNGLSLPGRGVVKALFLSGAEVVPAAGSGSGGGDGGGADGADAISFRQRRRRSLSEGVAPPSSSSSGVKDAATLQGSGSEESKSSWSGRAGQAG
ncbi:unnamed protein product, partial [Ectocarpus sp. 12 AP-2014]